MSLLNSRQFQINKAPEAPASFKDKLARAAQLNFSGRHLSFFQQISALQSSVKPGLIKAESFVFLSDHGIRPKLKRADSVRDVAHQALASLKRKTLIDQNPQQGLKHYYIDVGLEYSFESNFNFWLNHSNKLVSSKLKEGTESFSLYPAMTHEQMQNAFDIGRKFIDRAHYHNCDMVFLSSAAEASWASVLALLKALYASEPIENLGSRLNRPIDQEDLELIDKAFKSHPLSKDHFTNLCFYGGFETAALLGAQIRCAELGLPFVCGDEMAAISWAYAQHIEADLKSYGVLLKDSLKALIAFEALSISDEYPNRLEGDSIFLLWALLQNELRAVNQMQ